MGYKTQKHVSHYHASAVEKSSRHKMTNFHITILVSINTFDQLRRYAIELTKNAKKHYDILYITDTENATGCDGIQSLKNLNQSENKLMKQFTKEIIVET